jgi:hypothetical protein
MRKAWMAVTLLAVSAPAADWKAGVSKILITPRSPVWMAGYAARTKPSEGTLQDLYVKALALEDRTGRRVVLVSSDLLGFPAAVADNIAARVEKQHRLGREALLLNSSHTHGGPVVGLTLRVAYRGAADYWPAIEVYTRELEDKVVEAVGAALTNLEPAQLSFGRSQVLFAGNRRLKLNPKGPVDHDVPVLRVQTKLLRAVVFGYACHNTTVGADMYQFHGDYAGFAQEMLEQVNPAATVFFLTGCGADANPNPRGTVDLARKHGETLAEAVEAAFRRPMRAIRGPLTAVFDRVPVAFAPPPDRAEWQKRLADPNAFVQAHARLMLETLDRDGRLQTEYPYPVQVWQFGRDLTLVALAGEVVVDYALRLKRELGAEKTWVAGYSNDVFAYIPSRRVLEEGGYEGEGAMLYYGQPGKFAPGVEETIIGKVHELVKKAARR